MLTPRIPPGRPHVGGADRLAPVPRSPASRQVVAPWVYFACLAALAATGNAQGQVAGQTSEARSCQAMSSTEPNNLFTPPFAEEMRQALEDARRLAHEAQGNEITPAFIVLGVTANRNNTGSLALRRANVDVAALARRLRRLPGARAPKGSGPDLAYSRLGVAVLYGASDLARSQGRPEVTTQDLLAGVVRCGDRAGRELGRAGFDAAPPPGP